MKRIAVIYTGGTIGSRTHGQKVSLGDAPAQLTQEYLRLRSDVKVCFEERQPFELFSEDIHPKHWGALCEAVRALVPERFDGIIITHGTDTLAYSAAALSLLLCDLACPVLLVSSHMPLDQPGSNGRQNFFAAVDYILCGGPRGVYAPVFQNGVTAIHEGGRLMQCRPFSHAFESLGGPAGQMLDGVFLPSPNFMPRVISPAHACVPDMQRFPRILRIEPFPGLDYRLYDPERTRPDAVIHGLYHSATACSRGDANYAASAFVRACTALEIPVYLLYVPGGSARYPSFSALCDAGAIPCPDMTAEMLTVRILLGKI